MAAELDYENILLYTLRIAFSLFVKKFIFEFSCHFIDIVQLHEYGLGP
jgi:hypothetical protein